jgi:sugar phosphate isomerase/epimerase
VNFLNHIEDIVEMVLKINHPNVKLMLDVGHLDKNELYQMEKYKNIKFNVDVSTNDMIPLSSETDIDKHMLFIKMLKNINYTNKINLEMLSKAENYKQ